jgi:hypothetical protein
MIDEEALKAVARTVMVETTTAAVRYVTYGQTPRPTLGHRI